MGKNAVFGLNFARNWGNLRISGYLSECITAVRQWRGLQVSRFLPGGIQGAKC